MCNNKHDTSQCNVIYVFVPFNTFIGIMKLKILKKIDNEKYNIKQTTKMIMTSTQKNNITKHTYNMHVEEIGIHKSIK